MLFHRTSRRLSLTDSGRGALERASRILAEGEAVEAEVTAQASQPARHGAAGGADVLRRRASGAGAAGVPARYPEVALDVDFDDGIVDLVGGGFDLALRISALADSSLLARRLCGVRVLLVASPAYLDAHGRPRHPRDLAEHSALFYTLSRFGNAWRFQPPHATAISRSACRRRCG